MLTIKKEFLEKIISHSRKEFPHEACGILAGRNARVEKVYEMVNTEKSPERYFMDPKEQLKVMKEIRNLGWEMLGIYHSHVAHPARPSAHDIEMAFYPDVSYVILSLENQDKPLLKSFKIQEGKVTEEEVKIE